METNCPAFEEWWKMHGLRIQPAAMEGAFKEIAFKGWIAAATKCAVISDAWGTESASVIKMKCFPK